MATTYRDFLHGFWRHIGAEYTIPPQFHFLWGGKKMMPDSNLENVLRWHATHPNFPVYLWIDSRTTPPPEGYRSIYDYYDKKVTELVEKMRSSSHDDPIDINAFKQKFIVRDVVAERIASDIAYYETDRLRPNWGTGGDILRYKILYQYGGVYLDSDIAPGPEKLTSGDFFIPKHQHSFYVDHNSQDSGDVGSDFIIANPGNPLLQQMSHEIEENYTASPSYYRTQYGFPIQYDAYCSNEKMSTERTAPKKTGPGVIRHAMERNETNRVSNVYDISSHMRQPVRALGGAWIINKPVHCNTFNEALEKTLRTIAFELTTPGIFRLEDHVNDIAAATHTPKNEVLERLLPAIEARNFSYRQLKLVQLTYEFPEVTGFYIKHHLYDRRGHYPDLLLPKNSFPHSLDWALVALKRTLVDVQSENAQATLTPESDIRIKAILGDLHHFLSTKKTQYRNANNLHVLGNIDYCCREVKNCISYIVEDRFANELQKMEWTKSFMDISNELSHVLPGKSVSKNQR